MSNDTRSSRREALATAAGALAAGLGVFVAAPRRAEAGGEAEIHFKSGGRDVASVDVPAALAELIEAGESVEGRLYNKAKPVSKAFLIEKVE